MSEPINKIPTGSRQWVILGGGAGLLLIAVLAGVFFRGGRSDPKETTRLAAEQLTAKIKALMDAGKFDTAGESIKDFLEKHPDAPGLSRLWALRIVSHRKAGDLTKTLRAMAGMAEKFQGRGGDLCDVGDILLQYECLRDAVGAFDLAAKQDASVGERACYQAAMCNYRLGRFAMAMKYIDDAAALSPDDPKIAAAVKKIEDSRFVATE